MAEAASLVVMLVIVVLSWRRGAESERSADIPAGAIFSTVYFAGLAIYQWFHNHDVPYTLFDVGVSAAWASVIWDWWRRRRQGKPSRVLGIVRDLGHKLTVQPIHGEAS